MLLIITYFIVVTPCGEPPVVAHGEGQVTGYVPEVDSVTFSCQEGFKLEGTNTTLKCKLGGIWAGSLPQCTGETSQT